jgi:hypothetical protein
LVAVAVVVGQVAYLEGPSGAAVAAVVGLAVAVVHAAVSAALARIQNTYTKIKG